MELFIIIMLILICLAAICFLAGYITNFFFAVNEYDIISDELYEVTNGGRIVIISDLHNASFGKNNEKLLKAVDDIKPTFIIMSGDIVNRYTDDNNANAKYLTGYLAKKYKIYYADGNHEQGLFTDDATKDFSEEKLYDFYDLKENKKNLIHLVNDYIEIKNVRIYGFQIKRSFYKRLKRPEFTMDYLEETLGEADKNYYNLLIAHNPMYYEKYADWGANLVISGHLHGGMVRLPFVGGVISPQLVFFPKYSGGMYEYKNSRMILSKGLGTHTIKFRLFNIPELSVINVKK